MHEPIKAVAAAGRIVLLSDPAFGFMHTPQEMLQALRILRRDLTPPPEIADLVSLTGPEALDEPGDLFQRYYGDADIIGVEVSSLRYALYGDWLLQVNRVRDRLSESGLDAGVSYRDIAAGTPFPEEKLALLAARDPLLFEVLQNRRFISMSREDLKQAVHALITSIGKPVLLVGHFVDTGPFKGVNPSRRAISEVLKEVAAERTDTGFLDPTGHIADFGFKKALVDDSHYAKEYFLNAGDKICRAATALYRQLNPALT